MGFIKKNDRTISFVGVIFGSVILGCTAAYLHSTVVGIGVGSGIGIISYSIAFAFESTLRYENEKRKNLPNTKP